MREHPIEFPGFAVDWAKLKRTVTNPGHRNNFGIVSSRENLIRLLEILIGKCLLDHRHTAFAQKPNYPLASDTRQKCSIRRRCKDYAIPGHKNVRGRELCHIAQHVANNRIIEAAGVCLEKRTSIIGIQTSGLGIHWHVLERWPTIGR